MTPTILTVYDAKNELVATTVIDYDQIDKTVAGIKDACEQHQWHHRLSVPWPRQVFLDSLNRVF